MSMIIGKLVEIIPFDTSEYEYIQECIQENIDHLLENDSFLLENGASVISTELRAKFN